MDALPLARDRILAPSGLDEGRLEQTLGSLLGAAVDAGDLYFQLAREEHWVLEDGIVKEGSYSIEQGVGVRAMAGERTGFAYSEEVVPAAAARLRPWPPRSGGRTARRPGTPSRTPGSPGRATGGAPRRRPARYVPRPGT